MWLTNAASFRSTAAKQRIFMSWKFWERTKTHVLYSLLGTRRVTIGRGSHPSFKHKIQQLPGQEHGSRLQALKMLHWLLYECRRNRGNAASTQSDPPRTWSPTCMALHTWIHSPILGCVTQLSHTYVFSCRKHIVRRLGAKTLPVKHAYHVHTEYHTRRNWWSFIIWVCSKMCGFPSLTLGVEYEYQHSL